MKVGITVVCEVCGRIKCPRGRSAPLTASMCFADECSGYHRTPFVGDLWPGETEVQFGYPVSSDGTREVDK